MSRGERLAPTAAAFSAISTLLCCLPLSFAGALGAAGLSAAAMEYRGWLIGISALLLVIGFVQVYRRSGTCARTSRTSVALLWFSALLVAVVFLMPQLVASLLADWLS